MLEKELAKIRSIIHAEKIRLFKEYKDDDTDGAAYRIPPDVYPHAEIQKCNNILGYCKEIEFELDDK